MKNESASNSNWLAHLVTALTAGIVLVTAIVVRPGIDAFLHFVMVVGGGGTVLHALIHWGDRRWSGIRSISLGCFGLLLLLLGWLEMIMQPDGVPAVYRAILVFGLMLPIVALMREESRNLSAK